MGWTCLVVRDGDSESFRRLARCDGPPSTAFIVHFGGFSRRDVSAGDSKMGRIDMYRGFSSSQRLAFECLEHRHLLATVTLEPTIDNTLYEDDFGTLSNGEGQHLFAGRTGPRSAGLSRRALMQFNLTDQIPADAVVTSVALQLFLSRTGSPEMQSVSLHRVLFGWGEGSSNAPNNEGGGTTATLGDATWIHRAFPDESWEKSGGDFVARESATVDVGGGGFYTWTSESLVDDVLDWLEDPDQNFGWILLGNESSQGTSKRFDSRENSVASQRPLLVIEFEETTPAPWQNPAIPEDVTGDGQVVPFDALLIINELNKGRTGLLPPPSGGQPPPFLDVNGDNQLAPIDALLVINLLNAQAFATGPIPAAKPFAVEASQIAAAIDVVFTDLENASRSRSNLASDS